MKSRGRVNGPTSCRKLVAYDKVVPSKSPFSLLSSQSVSQPISQSVIQTVISQSSSQLVGQSASHFDFKAKKSNANKKNNFTPVQRAESLSKLIPRKLELKDQWASFTGQLAMRAS